MPDDEGPLRIFVDHVIVPALIERFLGDRLRRPDDQALPKYPSDGSALQCADAAPTSPDQP